MDRVEDAYRWLWTNTTGREFTDIMRDDPVLFAIPAAIIIGVTYWKLPRRYWARALVLYVGLGIGFVAGHVFW